VKSKHAHGQYIGEIELLKQLGKSILILKINLSKLKRLIGKISSIMVGGQELVKKVSSVWKEKTTSCRMGILWCLNLVDKV
jgi:hypothetical protein